MNKKEIFDLYKEIKEEKVDISKLDDETVDIMNKLLYEEICLISNKIKKKKKKKSE